MTIKQWVLLAVLVIITAAGLVAWGVLQSWDAELALAVAGIWLSVAGFTIAIQQIRLTRSASLAAAKAVQDALRTMASFKVSALLPTLRHEVQALELAIQNDDAEHARQALNRWRESSLDVANALAGRVSDGHRALKQVEKARDAALDAKTALYGPSAPDGNLATVQKELEKACDELTTAASELVEQEVEHG